MYRENHDFIKPKNENIKIRRYLDFPKYMWTLDKSALYFSRSDKLSDKSEGSFPVKNAQHRKIKQEKLIETSPAAQTHYLLAPEYVIEFYGLNKPIKSSEIDNEPNY